MQQLSDQIVQILKDYHNYNKFQITTDHVLNWVNQFDDADRQFILEEFLYLLKKGIYISEEQGRCLITSRIEFLARKKGYNSPVNFLRNTDFLRLQKAGKSQDVLLSILNEILQEKWQVSIDDCGSERRDFAFI